MNNDNGIAQADDICVSYKDSKTYGSDGNISMEISSHSMLIHPLIIANDDIYRSFNKHKRSSSRAGVAAYWLRHCQPAVSLADSFAKL